MAKTIIDMLKDDSPKMAKKINKCLESKNCSVMTKTYFESFRQEAISSGTAVDFPKVKIIVTNSYICSYEMTFGFTVDIVPLSIVENVYRSNIINGEYDYESFYLAIEMSEGRRTYFGRTLRVGKKNLDAFVDVINTIKSKKAL